MSSSTSAPGQRRASRGLEDATNKKRQKDRANQESKESERPPGSDPKKDLLLDWKQNADEVIVKLNLGSGALKLEEVDAAFTDTDCVVRLPDGRQWSGQFYGEIESSCSKVQGKKGNFLQLVLQKKIPLHTWASLLVSPPAGWAGAWLCGYSHPGAEELEPSSQLAPVSGQREGACAAGAEFLPCSWRSVLALGTADGADFCSLVSPSPAGSPLSPGARLPVALVGRGSQGTAVSPPTWPCPVLEPEPMVSLTLVKNDSYEKGSDSVVVHVYVKEIHRETSKVLFREQDFTLVFQTRNLIEPDQCTYNFTVSRINICLKKRHSQRWGGLEAPAWCAKVDATGLPPWIRASLGGNQHPFHKEEAAPGERSKPRAEAGAAGRASWPGRHRAYPSLPWPWQPKPMCMVPPMTHSPVSSESVEEDEEEEEKKVCLPGFTGLVNLGNTCFMNSVIQSLSNTRELRDYFHDRSFEAEINYTNPLGTGGRLAIGFAVLLRALWKGTHHAFQPSKLKAIVASKASQFTGYAQHDAQEFMAFLLDGLHEDLNRIQNKPYTETVDSDGRPDEVVAEEAWQRHKMRNDSFIVDLFQGQYKSKLVCPVCSKVSITFDPFLYLPVPLPQKQKVLTVYYFAKEPHKKPVKFLVSISKENSSAVEVLESVAHSMRVKPENLRLAEVIKNRFHRMFPPSQSLDTVSPTDLLLCFEVLSPELAKERVVVLQVQQRPQVPSVPISKCAACQKMQQAEDEKLKRCTRCYRVGYCNVGCQKTHWPDHKALCRPENIGFPFLISVPESRLTYSRLAQLLEGYARYSVSVFQPPFQLCPQPLLPEKLDLPARSSCAAAPPAPEAGDANRAPHRQEPQLSTPELHPELGEASTVPRSSTLSSDSGCSEHSLEVQGEGCWVKEPSYERGPKPEAAVPGYQHAPNALSAHATQFYINKIDGASREHKLEDKGDAPLELTDDCSLALVWKNNERLKEFVLVESKELECVEDPGSASEAARAGHFTLGQCLNLFTKPEVLAPEEAWYCPKCKQHREASKQLMLWRLPNVLIIQLKRFSFRSFIWRDKINDMVDFPVRSLDLSKFCIGQKEEQQQPMYDLYAVINHYGGMIGGHYTAYARLPSDKSSQRSDVGWRLFDDSTVTTVDESQVVTRYAYVLFYRRRNSPVGRPPEHRPDMAAAEPAASQVRAAVPVRVAWPAAGGSGQPLAHRGAWREKQGCSPRLGLGMRHQWAGTT
uniref:ubiquitinyl hydrolase 1 n=1 Tax=Chelonoidis abingdonii TaxID=106734 RepID=A0A8C0HEW2_CHEAB